MMVMMEMYLSVEEQLPMHYMVTILEQKMEEKHHLLPHMTTSTLNSAAKFTRSIKSTIRIASKKQHLRKCEIALIDAHITAIRHHLKFK